jgi:toxin ParE1/3/4
MGHILLTRQAEEDLLAIWSYVADDNPPAADGLLDDIDAACATLAGSPHSGRLREELAPNIRSLPVGNYVIFYRPEEDGIIVIRVLHGARDLPGLL